MSSSSLLIERAAIAIAGAVFLPNGSNMIDLVYVNHPHLFGYDESMFHYK